MTGDLRTGGTATPYGAVAGWDGSPAASRAADWVAEHQLRDSHPMELVRVLDSEPGHGKRAGESDLTLFARAGLESEARRLRHAHPGLRVVATIRTGDPVSILQGMSKMHRLVAVGVEERSSADVWAHPSMGERLSSTAAGPVAVIPDSDAEGAPGIVVGVDGSEASLSAALFAAEEASRRSEPLIVVHAWLDPATDSGDSQSWRAAATLLKHRHEALVEEALVPVVMAHPSLEIRRVIAQGLAVKILLVESSGARMLVIGNHARRHVARYLLGSVSTAVLRAADGVVVVVKSDDAD